MYKTICVYSSSSDAIAPEFFAVAEELGAALAGAGYGLIYGGARVGLMGAVARAVHAHGGHVVGVLPGVLQRKELTYEPADELIITQDLRERKAIMETRADAFIALPGGFGTLEEVLEILTLKQLLLHSKPLVLLNTDFAVYIGIVYSYLPFMILPLYANLEKHDVTLLEAAADLGAHPFTVFRRITLPLSLPGIAAGSLLVFIPAVGEYIIPSLLGRSDQLMIGRVLSDEFFENRDWPVASAVAILMLLLLVVPIMLLQRLERRTVEAAK